MKAQSPQQFPKDLRSGGPAMMALSPQPGSASTLAGGLLQEDAANEIARGRIPDLRQICLDLLQTFYRGESAHSALQFIPVMKAFDAIDRAQALRFLRNPKQRHVLVEHALLKVVLIHWSPGEISSIHGHPAGGCVFKVLQGSVEELRYTTGASAKLLSVSKYQAGSMAYIDDDMGYHAVGNPFDMPAISLHAYTPGIK